MGQEGVGEESGASEGTRYEGESSERGLKAVHGQSAVRYWWWTDGSILARILRVGGLEEDVGFSILDSGGEIVVFAFVFSIKLGCSYS